MLAGKAAMVKMLASRLPETHILSSASARRCWWQWDSSTSRDTEQVGDNLTWVPTPNSTFSRVTCKQSHRESQKSAGCDQSGNGPKVQVRPSRGTRRHLADVTAVRRRRGFSQAPASVLYMLLPQCS